MSHALILILTFLIVFSIIASSENFVEAKSMISPLDQYLQYRTQYGKDTAREDMMDNQVIDNSINSVEFTYAESVLPPKHGDSSANTILIQRTIPDDTKFVYHWEQSSSSSGSEYSSYINQPITVTFLDEKITIPDNSASQKLLDRYGILLSDEEADWGLEKSHALLETMETIPQKTRDQIQEQKGVTSKWILSDKHINNNIKITKTDSYKTVEISSDVFESSTQRIALVDDKMGKYFSQRLHHALIWFVTDEGTDYTAIEKILNERFGVSTNVIDYTKLTQKTTGESEKNFQKFNPLELVEIINMFEEMPSGFHSIDGLNYIVRRADGTTHPLYQNAPAVSWPLVNPGYMEFMESAFTVEDDYLHKLIIHEKSHFLWEHLFSDNLKNDWINLGGWYKDNHSKSGWATHKTTEFVSAYAHLANPDEDMAESIAHFVINPDKLKSRSVPKYEFIRDRIMEGNIYIPTIRKDLTFDVLNLYPDYIYPGKIIRIDILVDGKKNEEKHGTIEIELSGKDKFQGAKSAYLRLLSEQGTYKDITLLPVDGEIGLVLRGNVTISNNSKGGLWQTDQIVISDQIENQRLNGQNDFGWKFFVNNSNEDITPPSYVKKSLRLTVHNDNSLQSRSVQSATASWRVENNQDIKSCYATIDHDEITSRSVSEYGEFDSKTNTCIVNFKITEYFRTGNYNIKQIVMSDTAGNYSTVNFTNILEDNTIFIRTTNPDVNYPYLDTENISITANPTNPIEPNGETNIKIIYYAKDDKSGLGHVSYILRDPQGIQHNFYHYHKNFHSLFFDGNPSDLARYDINLILPEGSAPGKWSLIQIKLDDKANNSKSYDFTELIHFNII
ncbi:MAG: hypothetical protein JHC41_01895 [Nitrosopumilus sp.]|nr:hypothetical protein [Nitrosopumilus sp.]